MDGRAEAGIDGMSANPDTFDFWNEAETDAALERIHATGGKALERIRAMLNEGMEETADEQAGVEELKRHIRLWRLEQSRLCDAMLTEAGSAQEAHYLAVIERAKQNVRTGQPEPLETIQAELTRILDLPNNPRFHWLKAQIEQGRTDIEEGRFVTLEAMNADLDRIMVRTSRKKP
jgi:vacuolar-type H+-ATPase subunit E/Vma4